MGRDSHKKMEPLAKLHRFRLQHQVHKPEIIMNKTFLITAFIASIISTSAFAHHPAADVVDPEIYSMIDDNVSDTPHADLTFEDMGAAQEANTEIEQMREAAIDMESDPEMDTMTMLENLEIQVND